MVRHFSSGLAVVVLSACTGRTFLDDIGFGDTGGRGGGGGVDCVTALLDAGPSAPAEPNIGLAWMRLAPGVAPQFMLDGPVGTYRETAPLRSRVGPDGSTVYFLRPDDAFEPGGWQLRGYWPQVVDVLDPDTLEVVSSTTFCSPEAEHGFTVADVPSNVVPELVVGDWWLRSGQQHPDGQLLARLLDGQAPPNGRGLAFHVSEGGPVTVQARLRSAGVPQDGCDAPDTLSATAEGGVRTWSADAFAVDDAAGGRVVLHDAAITLVGTRSDALIVNLAAQIDVTHATPALQAQLCEGWAPQAGLACGACPEPSTATACVTLDATGLLLERPVLAPSDDPVSCPSP